MWLHLPPSITSPSSPASADSTSACGSPCLPPGVWVTSRGKPLQQASLRRGWKRVPWMRHLFGRTCAHSQAPSTEAVSAWLSAVSPAKTSVSPDGGPVSTEREAHSTSTSSASLARWDASTSSWRTCQASLFEASSNLFSGRLPKTGGMRNGFVSARPTWAPPTGVNAGSASPAEDWSTPRVNAERTGRESLTRKGHWSAPSLEQMAELSAGELPREYESEAELTPQAHRIYEAGQLWRTPVANDDNKTPEARLAMKARMGGNRTAITSLQVQTQAWPTPHHNQTTGAGAQGRKGGLNLQTAASEWPTPQAHDAAGGSPSRVRRYGTKHGAANLADDVTLWRTPAAGHPEKGGAQSPERRLLGGHTLDLQDQASFWQTPAVANTTGGHRNRSGARSGELLIKGQAQTVTSSHLDPPTPAPGTPSSEAPPTTPRRLNPLFVEWLMGFPSGWTILVHSFSAPTGSGHSAIPSYLSRLASHFRRFGGVCIGVTE